MKLLRRGGLLFRTYLIIVGGLIATAAVFDYGFGRLQEALAPPADGWATTALALIETRLAALPEDERPSAALALEREIGVAVRFLPSDAVVRAGEPGPAGTQEIFDDAGRSIYLKSSDPLGGMIRVGPVGDGDPAQSGWLDLVPHLFYLTILVLVALWLWPLIRDIDLLTGAAHDFAADYRQPMATRAKATTLQDLAASFDEMSARIRSLIQGQKDLTSALSHEIRTPLARIKFALAMLPAKTSAAEELHSIEEDVREIDRLIATMLEFARLDHPETQVNWQAAPAQKWLDEVTSKVLLRDDQRLRQSATAGTVRMDPGRMALAASNLLVNACRYARHEVAIALTESGDGYVLAVEDDGPGIPEADREKIFKAFTRLDDSRSRGTGGYGLGLAIVARIAALHGGHARAERSTLGGARIVIAWPRSAQAARDA